MDKTSIKILLVEDDVADVELTMETLEDSKITVDLSVVNDGVEALKFLRKEPPYENVKKPDLILLDLNMPRMDGRETLQEMKKDENLRLIPVVVLTTSSSDRDVMESYGCGANCYITKPVGLEQFSKVVRSIEDFWFTVVKLPK